MQKIGGFLGRATALTLTMLILAFAATAQRTLRGDIDTNKIVLGEGMSLMTPDLMQFASESGLFLRFSDKLSLTNDQAKKLGELFLNFQIYSARRQADWDVADAELRRLLTNDVVDLTAVRTKIAEMGTIQSEQMVKKTETVLQAIDLLTHDQHLKVMLFVLERSKPEVQANS